MKVLVSVLLAVQVLVSANVTVPVWIKYKAPRVATVVPVVDSSVSASFYPKNVKQVNSVQLQYRVPNNQNLFVNHPKNNEQDTPQSYQIVHFDNQKDVPIISTKNKNAVHNNNKQYLTEVNPPIRVSILPKRKQVNHQNNEQIRAKKVERNDQQKRLDNQNNNGALNEPIGTHYNLETHQQNQEQQIESLNYQNNLNPPIIEQIPNKNIVQQLEASLQHNLRPSHQQNHGQQIKQPYIQNNLNNEGFVQVPNENIIVQQLQQNHHHNLKPNHGQQTNQLNIQNILNTGDIVQIPNEDIVVQLQPNHHYNLRPNNQHQQQDKQPVVQNVLESADTAQIPNENIVLQQHQNLRPNHHQTQRQVKQPNVQNNFNIGDIVQIPNKNILVQQLSHQILNPNQQHNQRQQNTQYNFNSGAFAQIPNDASFVHQLNLNQNSKQSPRQHVKQPSSENNENVALKTDEKQRENVDISETQSSPIYSTNLGNNYGRKYTKTDVPENEGLNEDENLQENEESNAETSDEKEDIVSEHELPREVPTKPIYPGEGQWAKYGLKHRPYVRPAPLNEAVYQQEQSEDLEDASKGHDIYEQGQQQFRNAKTNFEHDIATIPTKISPNEDLEDDSSPLNNKPDLGYVPEKLYTQVRRTESVQHLPRSAIDPEQEEAADRLKEVVKDSRTHTVYTEEGYEDTAYDHAGHEKNAENHEGYGEQESEEHRSKGRSGRQNRESFKAENGRKGGEDHKRRKLQHAEKNINEDYEHSHKYKQRKNSYKDEEVASSNLVPQILNSTSPETNIKTVTLKKDNNQSVNMEIHTEIKYTPQKKKHKFVKIIPSTSKENETLKRVKRYDKEKLSKKYIRQHPTYYWKRNRTTTTERTFSNKRKNFEAAFKTHRQRSEEEDYFEDLGIYAPKNLPESSAKTTTKTSVKPQSIPPIKPTIKPSVKANKKSVKTKTTSTSTTTSKPSSTTTVKQTTTTTSDSTSNTPEGGTTTIHPDLMNPELTTKSNKPATPKPPPVKIKKFKIKRFKRYTNDLPKIEVDLKEFTDVNKIKLPPPKPDLTFVKYPYYNLPRIHLHENSPLRYAEDIKNIPKKIENLSFYKSRDHIKCPEIPSNINPIPERIENQKEGESSDKMAEDLDLPRLKGLGDAIDCMKIKYFGEDPLDSPFFKEDIIEQPIPFFQIQNMKDKTNTKRELKIKILEPIVVVDGELIDSATANPIHSKKEAVLKPPYTLQEMMIMQEKLTPKSIYDQISILENSDIKNVNTKGSEEVASPEEFIILYDNKEAFKKTEKLSQTKQMEAELSENQEMVKAYTIKPQIRKLSIKAIKKLPVKTIRKPQPKTTTTTTTTTIVPPSTTQQFLPTIKPITRTLINPTVPLPITPKVPKLEYVNPTVPNPIASKVPKIERVNPTVPNPIAPKFPKLQRVNPTVPNPIAPKIPIIQLVNPNVPSPLATKAPEGGIIQPIQSRGRNDFRNKPRYQEANKNIYAFSTIFDISKFLPRIPNHALNHEQYMKHLRPIEQQKIYSDVMQNINEENNDESDSNNIAATLSTPVSEEEQTKSETKTMETSGTIIGMSPPTDSTYKTITVDMNQPDQISEANEPMNYFYFIGFESPEENHRRKRDLHSEKHHQSSRKQHPPNFFNKDEDLLMEETENIPTYTRPQYTEIRRVRPSKPKEENESEEEEDLNPRKRVYELKSSRSTTTIAPVVEQVEQVEQVEEIVEETPTTTAEPKMYPVEANKEDSKVAQYIFFVEKLHDKWAKEDATSTTTSTTEKPTEKNTEATVQVIAESVNESRGEPAYLQIINQLHEIREEEELKTTTVPSTTTTEEQTAAPMKNSNPFLPDFMTELNSMKATLDSNAASSNVESTRNRNFSNRFKTNIDTSKYKTIERAPIQTRHNLSSRFNSENEELPLKKSKTTLEPMIIAIIRPQSTTPLPKDITEAASTIQENSTNQEESTTTVKSRLRGRFRGRGTTSTTTAKPSTSTAFPIHRRRRPIVTTSTTTSTTARPEPVRRRHRLQKIEISTVTPSNHKKDYKPVTTTETVEEVVVVTPSNNNDNNNEEPKKQRRFQKVQERRIMSEVTLTRFYEPDSSEEDLEETKKHQYEVLGPLKNTDTFHGGNYKHEKDKKQINNSETYYTDSSLAEHVNNLTGPAKKASNKEDLEKGTQSPTTAKVGVSHDMAKMINTLAEGKIRQEDVSVDEEEDTEMPVFIADPSKRMYYYAKL